MTTTSSNQAQRKGERSTPTGELVVVGELPGMATVPVLAEHLEVSPSTVYRWIGEKKVVAWARRGEIKGPIDQVLGPCKPLPALAEIAETMDLPPELVWDFVSNPWRWGGQPPETPLQKLKRGEVEAVINAAPAYLHSMG